MSADVERVRSLANAGVSISPSDAWIIYDACLQGPEMIHALASNSGIDLNPIIPGHGVDRALHFLLRTPASKFRRGKFATIKALLDLDIEPYHTDSRGNNAVHILAGATDAEEFRLLQLFVCGGIRTSTARQPGLNMDCINETGGNTALIVAVQHNNTQSSRLLLEHGSDPNIRGEFGMTALSYAVARSFVGLTKLLISYGAKLGNDTVVT